MAQNLGLPVPPSQDSPLRREDGGHDEQLHRLSSSFAPFPDPNLALRQKLRDLAEEARSVAGRGSCAIGLLEGNDFVCLAAAGESAPSVGARIQTQDDLFVECIHSRRVQISQDTFIDSRVDAAACRAAGVRSVILVPLVAQTQELIGVLEASSPDSHAFGAAVSERMETIGQRIAELLAPARQLAHAPAAVIEEHTGPGATLKRALEMSQDAPRLQAQAPMPATETAVPSLTAAPPVATSTSPEPSPAASQPAAIPWAVRPVKVDHPFRLRQHSSQNLMLALGVLVAGAVLAALLWWVQQEKLRQDVLASAGDPVSSGVTQSQNSSAQSSVASSDQAERQKGSPHGSRPEPAVDARGQHVVPAIKSSSGTNPSMRSAKSGAPGLSSGDLVVYEKGKLIYRAGEMVNPPAAAPSAGTVTAPMKSAAENERLEETANPSQGTFTSGTIPPGAYTGGTLIHRVNPAYPTEALAARLEGDVVLQGVIGRDGEVREVRVVSGDPRLVEAAMEAVRHWRYDPFRSNGEPVDMLSTLTVHFRLPRAPNQ